MEKRIYTPGDTILIGYEGEKNARHVEFDIAEMRTMWPKAKPELLVTRPGEDAPYPAKTEMDGDLIRWKIVLEDAEIPGRGSYQILMSDEAGELLGKSMIGSTVVRISLTQSTGETPGPAENWVSDVLSAAQRAEAAASGTVRFDKEQALTAEQQATARRNIGVGAGGGDGVDEETVRTIVDGALEEAKESGEFDGPQGPEGPRGETGPQGQTGPQGERGEAGPQGEAGSDGVGIKSIVQTTTSSADGGTNVVTVTKTDGSKSTFSVKNGSKGSAGDQGPRGETGLQGETGPRGDAGPAGKAATIRIGSVTTLAAGSDATVTNSGTTTDAVFNFGIPKGADGKSGSGEGGADGEDGGYYIPFVVDGTLSWTATKSDMPPVDPADIRGPQGIQGERGETGPQGETGPRGPTGATGATGATGPAGADGTSVTVKSVSTSSADGGSNVVTFTDGKTLTVRNGSKGSPGDQGPQGEPGPAGTSGVHVGTSAPTDASVNVWINPEGTTTTETWVFTLADGSEVSKAVYVK